METRAAIFLKNCVILGEVPLILVMLFIYGLQSTKLGDIALANKKKMIFGLNLSKLEQAEASGAGRQSNSAPKKDDESDSIADVGIMTKSF